MIVLLRVCNEITFPVPLLKGYIDSDFSVSSTVFPVKSTLKFTVKDTKTFTRLLNKSGIRHIICYVLIKERGDKREDLVRNCIREDRHNCSF
ncbi:MAG: hypothetical protein OEZ01_03755 [Candidatus Heimdallarchaeota archaeon]|nr:hypothetical protein [Candidatus Heimdallarchaeota archaeon]MDH5645094.1 hypothetical protein [Candidatus Heimdallarchaeota archaeon]